jgi:hypothetical protein
MFDVPYGLPFHPSQLFCLTGQGLQSLLQQNCTIKVIYFVELVNDRNISNDKKFIIVYSIKTTIEYFLALEVTLSSNGLVQITRSFYEQDLSIIKSALNINYFNPQFNNCYTDLKTSILNNDIFKNLVSVYGWDSQNQIQWDHLRLNNINDMIHPVRVLQMGFQKVYNVGNSIKRIMVLNISNSQNQYVYLFRIDTSDKQKYYLGMKLIRNQNNLELITLVLDKERNHCENLLKVRILTREFADFYSNVTQDFHQIYSNNTFQQNNIQPLMNNLNNNGFDQNFLLGSAPEDEEEDHDHNNDDENNDDEFEGLDDEEFAKSEK